MDHGRRSPFTTPTERMTSGLLTSGTECWCASTAILSQPGRPGIAVDSSPRQPSGSEGAR